MFTILRYKKGFTLIEALVAISIILVGVTAAFTVAKFGIQSSSAIRNRVTAMFLAQEAMEAVKNRKDSNIQKISWEGDTSTNWLSGIIDDTFADYGCQFGELCGSVVYQSEGSLGGDEGNVLYGCDFVAHACEVVLYNGLYEEGNSARRGESTGFYRSVEVSPVPNNEDNSVMVTVTVWRPQQASFKPFVLKSIMYNWF
jgi:prepilin-type N-terminal cleavage/methylation domain-containing protein